MFANPMALAGLSPAALAAIPPYSPVGQNTAGPSTLNLVSPSMAGVIPMAARLAASAPPRLTNATGPAIRVPDPSKMRPQLAAAQPGGMFGHSSKAANIALAILAGLEGFQAGRGVPGAAQGVANLQNAIQYRRQQDEANATMQQNYQALIARGMNPNDALIMAQYPDEMAKHIGTHFDQKVLNQGDTLATPDLSGSLQTYTAPDIQRNGADVVQSPGVQGVTAPFSSLPAGGTPQYVGAPATIPGLRTDAEQYASTVAQPGTPAYTKALQDYTLKDHGPTAFGFDQSLQTQRLGVQQNIAYHRDATSAANNAYRVDHAAPRAQPAPRPLTPPNVIAGIMQKQASGQPLTPAEQGTLRDYRTHYKQQSGPVQVSPNEPVATDAHGNKLVVRNGQWVPAH